MSEDVEKALGWLRRLQRKAEAKLQFFAEQGRMIHAGYPQEGWEIPMAADCLLCESERLNLKCEACTILHTVHDGLKELYTYTNEPAPGPVVLFVQRRLCAIWPAHDGGSDQGMIRPLLEAALLEWVRENTDWLAEDRDPRRASLFIQTARFIEQDSSRSVAGFYQQLAHSAFHFSGAMMSPAVPVQPETTPHSILYLNILDGDTSSRIPQGISDAISAVTQEFIGYFHGNSVSSGQMATLEFDAFGNVHDPSVQVHAGQVWVEPFELPDDCVFCQRTTPERVRERIDGFQWAMDKEVSCSVQYNMVHGYPQYMIGGQPGEWEKRAAYRKEQIEWESEHPEGLHSYYLFDLPEHLQQVLVTKWNHVWRDWIAEDPRYTWRDGELWFLAAPEARRAGFDSPTSYSFDDVRGGEFVYGEEERLATIERTGFDVFVWATPNANDEATARHAAQLAELQQALMTQFGWQGD